MGFEQARFNMIEQQIRPWDVLNQDVLSLLGGVARENFTPVDYQSLAYADIAVPLQHGRLMMKPVLVARMLQALELHKTDRVLEIGTGSGYASALMAGLALHVDTVDINEDIHAFAKGNLAAAGIDNVTCHHGDGAAGWGEDARYDVIAITGSMPVVPDVFLQSLNRGGRMFVVVGVAPAMEAMLIRRTDEDEWSRESLFETDLPILDNAQQETVFKF